MIVNVRVDVAITDLMMWFQSSRLKFFKIYFLMLKHMLNRNNYEWQRGICYCRPHDLIYELVPEIEIQAECTYHVSFPNICMPEILSNLVSHVKLKLNRYDYQWQSGGCYYGPLVVISELVPEIES